MTTKLLEDDVGKKGEHPILRLPSDEEFKGPVVEIPAISQALADRFKRLLGDTS